MPWDGFAVKVLVWPPSIVPEVGETLTDGGLFTERVAEAVAVDEVVSVTVTQ